MRTKLRSKFTLLFMTFALILLVVPAVAYGLEADPTGSTTTAPTIQSDKDDYAPGELVTLTGSGWQANESVNIRVNDDAGQTWSRNVDVVADSSGNITDSFNLPNWFVATYSVTATGAQSGVATTSFTDQSIEVRAQAGTTNLAVTFPAGSVDRFNNLTCSGATPNQTNASAFTTLTNGNYVASTVNANNNQSATIAAPSPFTTGGTTYNFKNWTSTTGGVSVDSSTGCITRTGTTPANPNWDMTANYVEAPQVTSINRVDASPTNAGSVSWTVKFSQSVTGVDAGDFDLVPSSGLTVPSTNNPTVTGSGDTYTVTANTGSGDGTLGLNLDDDDSIIAGTGNELGGKGADNGDFTGQVYTIDRTAPTVTIVSTNPNTLEETGSSTITWKADETGTYSVRLGGTNCATATQVPSASGTNLSGNYTTANTNVVTTVDAAALAEGANTVRICVTDAATNVGSNHTTITKNLIRQTTTTLTQTAGTNPSTYGDSVTFTATVTASAGNPNSVGTVDFKNGSTVICDDVALSGNTATCSPSLNAGSYTLTAEYSGYSSGSPKFSASTSSPALSHTVNRANLTATANDDDREYGEPNPNFTGTLTGVKYNDGITATYTTDATQASDVGEYDIVPTLSDPNDKLDNYDVTLNNGTLTITQAPLTVNTADKERFYGDANPPLTGSIVGIKNNDNITATYSTTATLTSNVGPYPITATLSDPNNKLGNYSVSNPGGTLTVKKAPLSVAADNQERFYGDANPTLTGSIVGIKNGDPITASYTTTATPTSNVGPYAIVPSLNATAAVLANYQVPVLNNGTLTVKKAPLTLKANDFSRYYGEADNLTYSIVSGSFKNNDLANGANGGVTVTLSTTATATSTYGDYPITVSLGGPKAGNYDFTGQQGTLTIKAWSLGGFFSPVDMDTTDLTALNTVNGGSTVPLKFEVFQDTTELTSTNVVKSFSTKAVTCPNSDVVADEIEFLTTGSTSLRYDTTAGQFIQNWQTPKKVGCHDVTMTTQDGSKIVAHFKLR
jgi:hypothetical protein